MFEIEPTNYAAFRPLFAELETLHGSVRAVLADPRLGRILADHPRDPRAALLWGPEGLYFAGAPTPGRASRERLDAIEEHAYLYPSIGWQLALRDIRGDDARIAHPRIRLLATAAPPQPRLADGYAIVVLDEPLGFAVAQAGAIVSRCAADMVVGDYAELGVWTHPLHRRRGLGRAVVAASLAAAFEQGVREVGWHCHASNRGSLALAASLGFVEAQSYLAFSASLPAENVGDLPEDECRRLALHFEQVASRTPWLGFHAAGAWALAGETSRALEAVEVLVGGDWQGEAEWLETHWALETLLEEPRFKAAVQRHRLVQAKRR